MDPQQERAETFPELIAAIKDTYKVSESEIARRLDLVPATVNHWIRGKRDPKPENLRKLAELFPAFTEVRIAAAAGRRVPGPLSPDREQQLLEYFRALTEDQQRAKIVEMRAIAEDNQTAAS